MEDDAGYGEGHAAGGGSSKGEAKRYVVHLAVIAETL
jgi:hypothetical protein